MKQNTKYLKMNKSDLNKRETPGSLSSSAPFAVNNNNNNNNNNNIYRGCQEIEPMNNEH